MILGSILCATLPGCGTKENAKEISPQEFFDLRMENDWTGKGRQAGWFIIDDKSDFITIGYTSAKLASDHDTKCSKYLKCRKDRLVKVFPAFRELDGKEVRRLILRKITPIQQAEIDRLVEKNGSGGMSQKFDWSYRLTDSKIIGEVIWDYTVGPPPKKRHYEFSFSLSTDYPPELNIKEKTSNQTVEHILKAATHP